MSDQGVPVRRQLSREEYQAIQQRVFAQLPQQGQSDRDMELWLAPRMEAALAEAEYSPPPLGSAISRISGPVLQALNPATYLGIASAASRDPRNLAQAILGQPRGEPGLGEMVVRSSLDQGRKALDAFNQGSPVEVIARTAAMTPLAGPALASIGEKIGAGDYAGVAGELGAAAIAPKVGGIAMKPVTRALKTVSNVSGRSAEKAVMGAMKVDRSYLAKMAGSRPLVDKEREIVRTVLDDTGASTIGRGWSGKNLLEDSQGHIDTTSAARDLKIANAPSGPMTGSGQRPLQAVRDYRDSIRGDAPQERIAQLDALIKEMESAPHLSKPVYRLHVNGPPEKIGNRPRDVSVQENALAGTGNNETMRGLFGPGHQRDTELQGRLAAQRVRTDMTDEVAGTREASDKLRRLIDVRNVANIAARRIDATNPISLPDVISLSAAHPEVFLASQAMKGNQLMRIGRKLDTFAKYTKGADASRIVPSAQTALLQQLLQASMRPTPR